MSGPVEWDADAVLADGRVIERAGLGRRLAARVVDVIVLVPACLYCLRTLLRAGAATYSYGPQVDESPSVPVEGWLAMWAALAVVVLYEPVMVTRWGATLGKVAVGIRVVRFADGGRVSRGGSWARVALPMAAGVVTFGVGWFIVWFVLVWPMIPLGRGYRGWHDRIAGTIVVRRPAKASPARPIDRTASSRQDMDRRWREFMRRGHTGTGRPGC